MAIEYAHRYQPEYDVVWWISSDQVVLDARHHGEPYEQWLLIFDNADQPENISDFIRGWPC